jgi:tripartite-type tricarboxylate transporter receptor subunit TctC
VARIVAQWLTGSLRQPFVVDNRAGRRRQPAAQAVARWLQVARGHDRKRHNPTLDPLLPFNFLSDVAPVAMLVGMVSLVVVRPSVPANTLAEFTAPVIEKSGIKGSFGRTQAIVAVAPAKVSFLRPNRWQIEEMQCSLDDGP